MKHPCSRVLAAVLALASLASATAARAQSSDISSESQASSPTLRVPLFATSNTDGTLAAPRCRREPTVRDEQLAYAHQVGSYHRLERRIRELGTPEPLAFHLGDSTFPGPIGRFLLTSHPEGGDRLAGMLNRVPYTVHALGNQEIGLMRSHLDRFVTGARREGLPIQGANLDCNAEGGGEAVCEAVGTAPESQTDQAPYRIVERGSLEIGIVSVLDPTVRQIVAPSRLAGFDVLDPLPVLKRQLEAMRQRRDPDLVVVLYHATRRTSMGDTVDMTEQLEGVDLVVTNQGLHRQTSRHKRKYAEDYQYLLTPDTGTYVLAAGQGATRATTAMLHVQRTDSNDEAERDWRIERIETTFVDRPNAPLDRATARLLRRIVRDLCRTWGDPIATDRPLAGPFDRESLVTFVLNTMRFTTRAEIALANEGAFLDAGHFPIREQLTLADIYTILPFDNALVTARMSGETLAALHDDIGDEMVAVGVEQSGDELLVNGRPLDTDRTYRVATNQFTAEGGDRLLDPSSLGRTRKFDPPWNSGAPAISEIVIHQLESGELARWKPRVSTLSPTGSFPDLHQRLLWSFTGSLTTSYDQVTARNPKRGGEPVYDQPKLTVQSTDQIDVEAQLNASADSRNHGWDSSLVAHYATARVEQNGDGNFEETKDQVRGKTLYKYAGWRANAGGRWWVPMPTVELQAETEFDPPAQREWRQLEFTGIAGATFQLFAPFEIKIGADARRDVNDPVGDTTFGLAAAYRLERINFADVLGSPIKFESEVEYFFNDFRDQRFQEFRNSNRLYYAVFDQLHFTSTFTAFLFRSADVGAFGTNTELTVGLNYLWETSIQAF
jgi:2',3'-cyclic-nucleotide 2'-phosphodiesterase (5'-nucleotidase family)